MKGGIKRVTLECGGKSPHIIMDDADINTAVGLSHFATFLNNGQICMAGSRTFVHEKIYDEFVAKTVMAAKYKKIGDPFLPDTENGPLISDAQLQKVLNYVELGKKEGATLLCGGKRLPGKGHFMETTVFTDVKDHMTIAKEEIFGPVMCILKFKTIDEVIRRANDSEFGLVAGLVTKNLDNAIEISEALKVG